jgi:hypothetical protein
VNPALAAIAAVTIAGAVLAVSARDVRSVTLGLLVVLLGTPLIADPWPEPLAILARIAAALLATRFLMIALRGDLTTGGTRIGWPTEALIGAAAALVGFGSHGLGATGLGPAEAQAAGFAFVALAIAPLVTGRDVLRIGTGALLLLVAASSIRAALDAPPTDAEQLIGAMLTIGLGGAIAVISIAARTGGGLASPDRPPVDRVRRAPDAHRAIDADRVGHRQPDAHRAPDARRAADAHRQPEAHRAPDAHRIEPGS